MVSSLSEIANHLSVTQITAAITAIGALGTAAFGIVEASKLVRVLLPRTGFGFIAKLIKQLDPPTDVDKITISPLSVSSIQETLYANWVNGVEMASQKSTAKTLIKLRLSEKTAPQLAIITGVDSTLLVSIAKKATKGATANSSSANDPNAMTPDEVNVFGRFDLMLTLMINRVYQQADQLYVSVAQTAAGVVAVILAEVASYGLGMLTTPDCSKNIQNAGIALIVGLIATPLAPVAKNITDAICTAANAMQTVKK